VFNVLFILGDSEIEERHDERRLRIMEVGACTAGASSAEEVAEVNGVDAGERESGERESGETESRGVAEAKGVTEAEVEGAGRIPCEMTMRVLRCIAAAKFRHDPA